MLIIFFSIITSQVFDGHVLFTPFSSDENNDRMTILMDNDYNNVHTWPHDFLPASMPYLMIDGSIIYPYMVESPSMVAGGVGGGIQKILWDGTVAWDYIFADSLYQHHHDIEPLPNGNILVIVWEKKMMSEALAMGRIDIGQWQSNEMWSTAILELNPTTGSIDWEWHLWDHLIQNIDSTYGAFYGSISDHPELFNINCGSVGGSAGGPQDINGDWIHVNAIDYNPSLDQIVISSRLQNEIYIIDHSTTTEEASSHLGGNSGKGGDILYRWGNPRNYDREDLSYQILNSQHGVNWIPPGYTGEGNLILFNNFHENDAHLTYSAVLELSPPIDNNGNYSISENDPFGPDSLEWIFACEITVPMQGGAFRLPNGNTIITLTHIGTIIEIDVDGNNVWEYTHSADGVNNAWIARADKYNLDYLQNTINGDVNSDGVLNILDIVLIVNMVIDNQYNSNADINEDGFLDILDIVVLVNILIGS